MTPLVLAPHPFAPLFDGQDGQAILDECITLMAPGSKLDTSNEEIRQILRQACLVNLWFFLKYVAGYSGPYADINTGLHRDMANWRQEALVPGSRYAAFIPRSHCKSTILTHGACSWELLRNPDLRIGIFSSVYERALEFLHITQRTFDDNEIMRWLFPEYCIESSYGARWNDKEGVLPNRTFNAPEASIKAFTAGGSTQGIHVDLAAFDDLVGDSQLTVDRKASADMLRIGNWFSANLRTLLISPLKSRATLAATRYAADDPYENVMKQAKFHAGYWGTLEQFYPVDTKGEWNVYYRMGIENGEVIYPENFTVEFYERLAREDPWTYQTQYMNNPRQSSAFEFGAYDPYTCTVGKKDDGNFYIEFFDYETRKTVSLPMASCDVVMSADPAGSEKYVSMKTSKSAIVVVAQDKDGRHFIVEVRAGYVAPSEFFDWLFIIRKKYGEVLRKTVVETQGGFKILGDLLRQEEHRRNEYLHLYTTPALGDKVLTIRNIFEPIVKANKLYIAEYCRDDFMLEFLSFPSARMDILDAAKIAIKNLTKPEGGEYDTDDEDEERGRDAWHHRQKSPVIGY